jgi:threonine dehydratase
MRRETAMEGRCLQRPAPWDTLRLLGVAKQRPSTRPTLIVMDLPTYQNVLDAAECLRDAARRTPVLTSKTANEIAGADLFFKCENFQRAGAFKFRGAFYAISRLGSRQATRLGSEKGGVLAFSSGNHAQAIALSARLQGLRATIVMPQDAPMVKVQATQGYGAEVIRYDRYTESREAVAAKILQERGMTLIPPFDHPDVIAGQGTATKELIEEVGELDYLLVPMGGGGLLAGSALSASALSPNCKVIGVEPQAGDDGQRSFREGRQIEIPVPKTIADGAQTTRVGDHTFPIIQRYVHDIFTATDQQLVQTMRFFAERMKMIVEPTGCLAAAIVLQKANPFKGTRIGIVLSGGNIDLARFGELVNAGSAGN